MEIINLTEKYFILWNEFCKTSNDAWFWHTTDWIDYTINYKPELKTRNLSFLVHWKDKTVAIVPLTLEVVCFGEKEFCEFSFGGAAIPSPALCNDLSPAEKNEVYEFIFSEIDRMAKEYNVARACFRETPLSLAMLHKNRAFNNLLKFGYLDMSLNTQLIDLTKTEDELWRDLRRNHHRNIKKGEGFSIKFFDSENITKEVFNEYQKLHHNAAGRITRPQRTFDLMYKWLKEGLAFLVAVDLDGKNIGFEYYQAYKNVVYGFSAANDPDFADMPIRHRLEWEAILWMKRQGFRIYEIGLQQYNNLLFDFPIKKQLDISHFKRGYGGYTAPWFIGEKFYNKDYFLLIYQERIKKFAESI